MSWTLSIFLLLIRLVYGVIIIPITNYLKINYFLSLLLLSLFFGGYVIFYFPAGYIVDKFGYKISAIFLIIFSILFLEFIFDSLK